MVNTNNGRYFIAAGIGALEISPDNKIISLSAKSPLGIALLEKKKNEKFLFNSKPFEIIEIN